MKILVIAEKKEAVKSFLPAFEKKGFETRFLSISQINLVSKHKKTLIKAKGEDITRYDAIFLQARLNLAPFIEPLMDEIINQNIYSNCRPGSYYTCTNEPYEFVVLSEGNVPAIGCSAVGTNSALEKLASSAKFPSLAKSFKGTEAQQAIVVNNEEELKGFAKSIKGDIDGFVLREFIKEDVVTCAVVGEKVFSVKRKLKDHNAIETSKGMSYSPKNSESEAAIKAARVCGYDIAQIDLVAGKVISVKPIVDWGAFNKITSNNLEVHVAQHYADKVNQFGAKKTFADEVKEVGKVVSKTVFGGVFK